MLGLTLVTWDGDIVHLGGKALDTPGYDMVGLMVGSEGTMGIVTEVTVRLLRKPQGFKTVMALFDSVSQASDAVTGVIAAGILPGALEIMDRQAIIAVERGPLRVGYPEGQEAVLLIDVDGLSAGLDAQAESVVKLCRDAGCTEVRTASSPGSGFAGGPTARGPSARRAISRPDVTHAGWGHPAVQAYRGAERVADVGRKYDLTIANVFHAGDGNLHPLICYDERIPGMSDKALKAGSEILAACVRAGHRFPVSTASASRKWRIWRCSTARGRTPAAQKALHDVLDPRDLCNPGKIFP